MNIIWISISSICIIYGLLTGRLNEITSAILSLPLDSLKLTTTLAFTASFFNGIMNIMYESNLINIIAKSINPLLNLIMPNLKDEKAKKYISMNIVSNMFGLGFAATPAGLKAMKELKRISPEKDDVASDEMVTFLVLNTAGVTFISTNVIAIRKGYGAINPSDFMPLAIIGTILSSIIGLTFDYLFRKMRKNK